MMKFLAGDGERERERDWYRSEVHSKTILI
jgi:hypothetical protein